MTHSRGYTVENKTFLIIVVALTLALSGVVFWLLLDPGMMGGPQTNAPAAAEASPSPEVAPTPEPTAAPDPAQDGTPAPDQQPEASPAATPEPSQTPDASGLPAYLKNIPWNATSAEVEALQGGETYKKNAKGLMYLVPLFDKYPEGSLIYRFEGDLLVSREMTVKPSHKQAVDYYEDYVYVYNHLNTLTGLVPSVQRGADPKDPLVAENFLRTLTTHGHLIKWSDDTTSIYLLLSKSSSGSGYELSVFMYPINKDPQRAAT